MVRMDISCSKVWKLLDMLCLLFESEFHMHQSCTIDEAMIPFKGRLHFKHYMKDKRDKSYCIIICSYWVCEVDVSIHRERSRYWCFLCGIVY